METRNLIVRLRSLGYPKQISIIQFRQPCFPVVAEIAYWLVKSYDPNAALTLDINSEPDRIVFVKTVALILVGLLIYTVQAYHILTIKASKANLRLNTKRLYMADRNAVQELLKIADLLYKAHNMLANGEDRSSGAQNISMADSATKLSNLRTGRQLAIEITKAGADLYDLLDKEPDLRDIRVLSVAKQLEMNELEAEIKRQIQLVNENINHTRKGVEDLLADEANLKAKIERKRQELERREKRLRSLQGVRPAFMDEYERLETDLQKLYSIYVEKFRNYTYLDHQLQDLERRESERMAETEVMLKRLQSRAQQEELAILRDGGNVDAGDTGRDLKALLEDQVPMANTVASIQVPSFSIRKPVDELKSSAVPPAGTTPGTVKPSTAIARQPRVKGSMMDGDDNEDEDGNADVTNSAADLGDDNESHEDQPTSDIYDF